jgi:Putative membrane protein insertion efficiency factor
LVIQKVKTHSAEENIARQSIQKFARQSYLKDHTIKKKINKTLFAFFLTLLSIFLKTYKKRYSENVNECNFTPICSNFARICNLSNSPLLLGCYLLVNFASGQLD